MKLTRYLLACTVVLLSACSPQEEQVVERSDPVPTVAEASREYDIASASEADPLVVFLGDSLTAGFGVEAEEAFPAQLARLLNEAGHPIRFVNAGISGDTSAGGLHRIDWILSRSPDFVVVELGANDGLRGLDPDATEENLRQILQKVDAAGAKALLIGIFVPPNYGPDYSARFASIFPRLSEEEGVPLLPFLLEGVAGRPELNLADGVHPNPEGHRLVAAHVFESLLDLISEEGS